MGIKIRGRASVSFDGERFSVSSGGVQLAAMRQNNGKEIKMFLVISFCGLVIHAISLGFFSWSGIGVEIIEKANRSWIATALFMVGFMIYSSMFIAAMLAAAYFLSKTFGGVVGLTIWGGSYMGSAILGLAIGSAWRRIHLSHHNHHSNCFSTG